MNEHEINRQTSSCLYFTLDAIQAAVQWNFLSKKQDHGSQTNVTIVLWSVDRFSYNLHYLYSEINMKYCKSFLETVMIALRALGECSTTL